MAAAILAEPATGEEATRLLHAGWDLAAPSHWKAEFSNVLWKAVLSERIAAEQVDAIITRAGELPIESVEIAELWRGAVIRAIAANHPAYGTLFVELAIRLKTNVASFDGRLQRKFPSIVKRPAELQRS